MDKVEQSGMKDELKRQFYKVNFTSDLIHLFTSELDRKFSVSRIKLTLLHQKQQKSTTKWKWWCFLFSFYCKLFLKQ